MTPAGWEEQSVWVRVALVYNQEVRGYWHVGQVVCIGTPTSVQHLCKRSYCGMLRWANPFVALGYGFRPYGPSQPNTLRFEVCLPCLRNLFHEQHLVPDPQWLDISREGRDTAWCEMQNVKRNYAG